MEPWLVYHAFSITSCWRLHLFLFSLSWHLPSDINSGVEDVNGVARKIERGNIRGWHLKDREEWACLRISLKWEKKERNNNWEHPWLVNNAAEWTTNQIKRNGEKEMTKKGEKRDEKKMTHDWAHESRTDMCNNTNVNKPNLSQKE